MPETLLVPMRDGIRLATDVYLPSEGSAFPVVLERTPYGRHLPSRSEITAADREPISRAGLAASFTAFGYAVVFQDTRARRASGRSRSIRISHRRSRLSLRCWAVWDGRRMRPHPGAAVATGAGFLDGAFAAPGAGGTGAVRGRAAAEGIGVVRTNHPPVFLAKAHTR